MHDNDENDDFGFSLDESDTDFYCGDPIDFAKESDTSPTTALYRAVILQSILDIKNRPQTAADRLEVDRVRSWLDENNPDFREVCDLADYSPEYIKRMIDKVKADGFRKHKAKGNPKRKKRRR